MKPSDSPPPIPPDVARYLDGAPPESRQFDFLIGDWNVAATRLDKDGSVLHRYAATWSANYLNGGRMIMDDFKPRTPAGQAISSYVTLRTYSETTRRWEMVGLAALQPAVNAEWNGVWIGDAMQLNAVSTSPEGPVIRTRIRFIDIESDRFVWESSTSRDDGATWVRTASLVATRRPR